MLTKVLREASTSVEIGSLRVPILQNCSRATCRTMAYRSVSFAAVAALNSPTRSYPPRALMKLVL